MSAVLRVDEAGFEPMTEGRIEEVLRIERSAYEHPWTAGNFADSLRSGYQAQLLCAGSELLGYFVAMKGVDEVHLLNITVAPAHQRSGWGRLMLEALATWSRGQGGGCGGRDGRQQPQPHLAQHGHAAIVEVQAHSFRLMTMASSRWPPAAG